MDALRWLANLFYDPWIFWGAPLLLALALESGRRRHSKSEEACRPDQQSAPGKTRADRLRPTNSDD